MLFALVAFLVPVFEKVFKDFGGELPAITKFTVILSHMVTRQLVHHASAVIVRRRLVVPQLEELRARPRCSGTASS